MVMGKIKHIWSNNEMNSPDNFYIFLSCLSIIIITLYNVKTFIVNRGRNHIGLHFNLYFQRITLNKDNNV